MPAFDQEDVVQQRRNVRESSARLKGYAHPRRVRSNPPSPLLTLVIRVGNQWCERDLDAHEPTTSSTERNRIGPRLSALIFDSIALRSPTTTTDIRFGWMYVDAAFCTAAAVTAWTFAT